MDLEKYKQAVQFVVSDRLASTSFIQRKLQIGYNTAAAIMEKMEDDGIVSAANHIGKRDILVSDDFVLAESSSPVHGGESKPVETEGAKPKTYTGPIIRFTCSGCDVTANGPSDGLPTGWYEQQTARIGIVHRCPKCAEKNAVKIATSTMTTAEILNYDGGPSGTDVIAGAAQTRLKSYVERLNRLFDDLVALSEDIKEVKAEANGEGFDTKILTKVVRASRIDKVKRQEEQAIFDMYAQAAGLE